MNKINKVFFGCVFVFLVPFTLAINLNNSPFYLITKAVTSFSFVLTALFSFLTNKDKSEPFRTFSVLILAALGISFAADIMLELFFEIGFALFFVVQVVYLIAFSTLKKPGKWYFIASPVLLALSFLFERFYPGFHIGKVFIPVIFYVFSLVLSTVKSFDFLTFKNKKALLVTSGMILFLISDFLLEFHVFANISSTLSKAVFIANAWTYFPGQALIALSLSSDFSE